MTDDVRFCDQCGSPRVEGHAFCAECGARYPLTQHQTAPAPPPAVASGCPRCGAAITPGHQFCAECGTRLEPTPRADVPPRPEGRRRKGRAGPLILALVLVVLLGGAAAWGWRMLSEDDNPDRSGGTAADEAAESPSSDGSEPPTTAPDESPSGEPVTCWDGTSAPSRSDCPAVRGVEGMRFAFPSLDAIFDSCKERFPGGGKVRAITCRVVVSDGTSVPVVYSEWQTMPIMSDHYFDKYAAPPRTVRGVHVWETEFRPNGKYAASVMYTKNALFSLSATAETFEQANEAFDTVRWRSAGQLPPQ